MRSPTELSLRVEGMHCPACERLVVEAAHQVWPDRPAVVKHGPDRLVLTGPAPTPSELAQLGQRLEDCGYSLGPPRHRRWGYHLAASLTGGLFLGVFALLQASGLIQLFSPEELDLKAAFFLGLVASLSSCFALVGGLLVSYTAAVARQRPGWLVPAGLAFHGARLAAFWGLGGLLGALGDGLGWGAEVWPWMFLAAALVMIWLGLSLNGWVPRLPTVGLNLGRAEAGTLGTGLLLGLGSFFLPCGFTQSVQFQALAAGNFWDGAWLMLAFALGTLPVLGLVSLGLTQGLRSHHRRFLLRAAGTVVLGLGLFQTFGALRALGWWRL